jgi:hypothetical protein
MLNVLDQKVREMYAALDALGTPDLSVIKAKVQSEPVFVQFAFTTCADPIELANAASLLVANIASLKDHLKLWCKHHGTPFLGDQLINSNRSVALVHDLWNVDKHMELERPPRSGHRPKLQDLRTTLRTVCPPGAEAYMTFDLTGKLATVTSGGGSVEITLVAEIVDADDGSTLGHFTTVCEQAAEAWERELRDAGVPLP